MRIIAKGGDIDFAALAKKFNIRIVGPPLLGDKGGTIDASDSFTELLGQAF